MDYFKHYATASDSKSLNLVFDKFGHKGIAFWWMLLELCSENWDGKSEPEFQFHARTVATKLKSSLRSVRPWLELCSNLGMIAFASNENQFVIKVSKLMKIKTSRCVIKSNKKQLTVYKEKDIDIDKDIEGKTITITPDEIVDLFNSKIATELSRPFAVGLGGKHLENCITSMGFLPTKKHWEDLLDLCLKSDFLTGKTMGCDFAVTLTWLVDYDNIQKVLEGRYDNRAKNENVIDKEKIWQMAKGAITFQDLGEKEQEWVQKQGGSKRISQEITERELKKRLEAA